MIEDTDESPLDELNRGTYVSVQFGKSTRPKSLPHLSPVPSVWKTILRTRTAVGQVILQGDALVGIEVELRVVDQNKKEWKYDVTPEFLYPHLVERSPEFRFLDLVDYHNQHPEQVEPPTDKLRQDGLWLFWSTERIKKELTDVSLQTFLNEIASYKPTLYAFIPYQGSVWGEMNEILTGVKNRNHLAPGMIIAVNRQRLADSFPLAPTRFETLSRNILVVIHFEDARPDQGRKTVQDEVWTWLRKRQTEQSNTLPSNESY